MPIGFHEILLEESPVDKVVTLKFREKLSKKNYNKLVPRIGGLMRNGIKIRPVVELHDFKGWTASALWENTKFATRHFNDVKQLAVVGDSRWKTAVTVFVKPFTKAQVRYFGIKKAHLASNGSERNNSVGNHSPFTLGRRYALRLDILLTHDGLSRILPRSPIIRNKHRPTHGCT